MMMKDQELDPQEQENHQAIKASALGTNFGPRGWSVTPGVATNKKEKKIQNTDFEHIIMLLQVLEEGNKSLTIQNVWNW